MKTLVKRLLRPYHLELGCVEAYGDDDEKTIVYQTTEPTTFVKTPGDTIKVTGTVKQGRVEAPGDTTWSEPKKIEITATKEDVKKEAPFGTKGIVGRIWDWVMDQIDDT